MFGPDRNLLAVSLYPLQFRYEDDAGHLHGNYFRAQYGIPVWPFWQWIVSVIGRSTGADSSSSSGDESSDDELRRRLTDGTDGLPMTPPPPATLCEPEDTACTLPGPRWQRSILPGAGNYRGTALAACAQADGNTCTFAGTTYPSGTIAHLPLGPKGAPGTTPREVMVWCSTSSVFAEGSSARPALRVSFTNGDDNDVPVAQGWWDLTPDQVSTGTTPLDPTQFTAC
jgi:hypothetical protein